MLLADIDTKVISSKHLPDHLAESFVPISVSYNEI